MHFNWKPSRVFYGWWIVASCFLIALYTGGVIGWGFTAFFEPIANELGWSYTQVSLAASLRGLEVGLLAPFVGMLVDRWGPRKLIFGGLIIASFGYMLVSRTTSLGVFYGAFALVAIGWSGCSATVLMTAVANWFRKKVGIAIGIMTSGWGFSGLIIPLIVRLIDLHGWRTTMVILAMVMLIIGLPLSLVVRHKPEQYGYLPDGEVKGVVMPDQDYTPAQTTEVNIRAKQALKSNTFWHIALPMIVQGMMISAVSTHVMPYLSSIGIARATSALVATAIPLMSVGGRLGCGWLGDRVDKRRVMAVAFAMMGLSLLCFNWTSYVGTWLLIPFLILFGIGFGGNNTMRASIVIEFFGRNNFGTIFGFITGMMMLGFITGPALVGWVFDTWGSYQGIWFVFAGLTMVALIIIITTPPVNTATTLVNKT